MCTMKVVRTVAAVLSLLSAIVGSHADARVVSATNGTITLHSGTRTGLQQVFAWNKRCLTLPVSFSGGASSGSLRTVGGVFTIGKGHCAGRKVNGFTVVYLAPANVSGVATVQYSLRVTNNPTTYRFTRRMIIK